MAVIAALVLSAAALSYLWYGDAQTTTSTTVVTDTHTDTYVTISTTNTTVTVTQTACVNAPGEGGTLSGYDFNSTTDCGDGLTLNVAASPADFGGQNETLVLSLVNDFPVGRDVNYTTFPTLPGNVSLSLVQTTDYITPPVPQCGGSPPGGPIYVALYNSSGGLLQLADNLPPIVGFCPLNLDAGMYWFNASQAITTRVSLGGYWMSPNSSEPWMDAVYNPLPVGQYTAVVFDPWGQLIEVTFSVFLLD